MKRFESRPRHLRLYNIVTIMLPVVVPSATTLAVLAVLLLRPDMPPEIGYQWGQGGSVRTGSLFEVFVYVWLGGVVALLYRVARRYVKSEREHVRGAALCAAVGYAICGASFSLVVLQVDGSTSSWVPFVSLMVGAVVAVVSFISVFKMMKSAV